MFKRIKRVLCAAAVMLVASAPAVAYARLDLNPGPTIVSAPAQGAVVPHAHRTTASASPGFHWSDAGIGAAGVVVLAGIGSGAVVLRQRRTRRPLTS